MKELYLIIDSYNKKTDYIVPFGFHSNEYEKLLYNKLKKYLLPYIDKIKRLWIIVGSGMVLSSLQRILIKTHFLAVQVAREIKDKDIYDTSRITIYKSSFKLYHDYTVHIKYDSVQSYDAKIFEFINKYGQQNDYIWNVAGTKLSNKIKYIIK